MLKAHKKNRSVRIPDEKAEEYKKLGYRITTMDGKTLYAPVDKDKEIADLKAENARLHQRITELNLELEQLRGATDKADSPEDTPGEPVKAPATKGGKSKKNE